MRWFSFLLIIILVVVFCVWAFKNSNEKYMGESSLFRSQRVAKGFSGVGYTEGRQVATSPKLALPDGSAGQTVNWGGYSLYSSKVNPNVYQPVTNTCYDEYMRTCSPGCNGVAHSTKCLEDCTFKATYICSQPENMPEIMRVS